MVAITDSHRRELKAAIDHQRQIITSTQQTLDSTERLLEKASSAALRGGLTATIHKCKHTIAEACKAIRILELAGRQGYLDVEPYRLYLADFVDAKLKRDTLRSSEPLTLELIARR